MRDGTLNYNPEKFCSVCQGGKELRTYSYLPHYQKKAGPHLQDGLNETYASIRNPYSTYPKYSSYGIKSLPYIDKPQMQRLTLSEYENFINRYAISTLGGNEMKYSHHQPHCSCCGNHKNDHYDRNHPHHQSHFHPDKHPCSCHDNFHQDKHSCSCQDDFHHSQIADSFLCDDRFQIRLGGLQGNLAFRLRQLIDCKVKMQLECGDSCEEILAKVCFVGSNFVEVKVMEVLEAEEEDEDLDEEIDNCCEGKKKKKKKQNKFRIIPMEDVKWVEFKENNCNCGHC
jgi:hypothetical protein